MKTTQYTIRNIPAPVDRYLRKRAKLSGRSLNQVIVDELSQNAGIEPGQGLLESLDWFIGSGSDPEVTHILEQDDREQKALAARELAQLNKTIQS